MGVSAGFQRKIEDWIIGEDWSITFCPFLTTTNPYKARVVIAGAYAQPKANIDESYIEALLNFYEYDERYDFVAHSRENKGVLTFAEAVNEIAPTVISNVNTLMVNSAKEASAQKKTADFQKGYDVFRDVLQEFQPEILILHGTEAVKQFRQQFATQLQDDFPHLEKVQELEAVGIFARLQLNENPIKILACRNLSQYGSGKTFVAFLEKIKGIVG